MTSGRRCRKAQRAKLVAELRATGETWTQIAARIRVDGRVGTLTAFRLAHGLSQQKWPICGMALFRPTKVIGR